MIPYISLSEISLGPLTLQVWGTFVALGIVAGVLVSARFAQKKGIKKKEIYDGAFWILLAAFMGARLAHVILYQPALYFAEPFEIIRVWNGGFSVMGGFAGAFAAFALLMRNRFSEWKRYADAWIYGLPLGLGIGRIGCFLIHDHPGTASNFFLAVKSPDGGGFHDHGLYLSMSGFLLAGIFFLRSKHEHRAGFYTAFFLIWCGIVRFALDFFRVLDTTYLGLTPAQYASLAMIAAGGALSFRVRTTPMESIVSSQGS